METPVYGVKYDDPLGNKAHRVVVAAEALARRLIKKDKRGFGSCKEVAELVYAIERFRAEEQRRVQNSPHFVTKIRILRERRITVRIGGEKRPWLLCVGDTATIANFGKNCYIAQAEDGSKAQYRLMFNKDGDEYETFQTPADRD